MRFSLSAISMLLFAATGLCAPPNESPAAPDDASVNDKFRAMAWDWCATDVTCYSDSDCNTQDDCYNKSKTPSQIECGTTFYPHSCWTFTTWR
ncbi:hypothetical protein V492_04821 [Pseudogymnoascus sp. VKM F-4246]|nr:hypothetical protein V492_04821 [Pseudogymnoascus sp. VKM F-4246]